MTLTAGLAAAPALADRDGDRGNSTQARENAPGQERKQDAGTPDPGNGNSNPPAHAGGPAAQSPPPGQAKRQQQPAQPARPGKPARPARPVHIPARPARPVHIPAKPARPVHIPAKPENTHAKAGKTTICHATGSATNPYVTITISDNALPAHARHHDGRDIIPAPAGGCRQVATAAAAPEKPAGGAHGDRDPGHGPGKGHVPAAGGVMPNVEGGDAPAGEVFGQVFGAGGATLPKLRDTIEPGAGERRESGVARPTATSAGRKGGELPFTGVASALVALLGVLLLLAGTLVRRAARGPLSA